MAPPRGAARARARSSRGRASGRSATDVPAARTTSRARCRRSLDAIGVAATPCRRARRRSAPGGRTLADVVPRGVGPARPGRRLPAIPARFGAVIERFRDGDGAHDPAQGFIVRTLLIHAYRRVLLRDPQLPAALLPLDWPGAAAYALCRDFYRLTHRAAERHLAATLSEPGDPWPAGRRRVLPPFDGLPRGDRWHARARGAAATSVRCTLNRFRIL